MKKIFLLLSVFVVLLCAPCALADDGVYVPSYNSFMEDFTNKVANINRDMWESILEDCFVDGNWCEPSSNLVNCWDVRTTLRIYEGNGFLDSLSISLSKERLDKEESLFKEISLAAALSIIRDTDATFEQTFFDNIYYDYAMESPANYISMRWNCGVYLFNFIKSSSDIKLEISLSVYEPE